MRARLGWWGLARGGGGVKMLQKVSRLTERGVSWVKLDSNVKTRSIKRQVNVLALDAVDRTRRTHIGQWHADRGIPSVVKFCFILVYF